MAALFAFLHHLAAFSLFAALVVQFVLIRSPLTVESARKLQLYDRVYGIAAVRAAAGRLGRVFHFEKGAYYYFHSWTFIAKLSLFVIVGLDLDHPDERVPALGPGAQGRTGARRQPRRRSSPSAPSSTTRWWAWC